MREKMDFDVVIVGAGPAGLCAAIRLAQLASKQQKNLNLCVIEKGAAVGDHILSGAVLEPRALDELLPNWRDLGLPIHTEATHDEFLWFSAKRALRLPTPPQMQNSGNYLISLGQLCRWLANYAESLGVMIFPGFAATEVLFTAGKVAGVATGDKGLNKTGEKTERFQEGIELYAKQTFFAEGCRGFLTQQLFAHFDLRRACNPQTYGLGLKELWEVPKELHRPGSVMHSVGWPLDFKTYGGGFLYHLENNLVSLGFVVGLDYQNPYFNPYAAFQQFKTHPQIAPLLQNAKRLAYGARALNEGGLQSLPKLSFPGGLILGCGAGFLNVPKIKGIHNAMKSGMVAAEAVMPLLAKDGIEECSTYLSALQNSWLWQDLHRARNIRPAMRWGLLPGLAYAAIDTYIFRGKAPWTLSNHADHTSLKKAAEVSPLSYPAYDQRLSFDRSSSVYLANLDQPEDQPCHLKLKDPALALSLNLPVYASPETRYCPAGVYEILNHEALPQFQISAANCVHCKACDIKDPTQNIVWTPPEGGSGPRYEEM